MPRLNTLYMANLTQKEYNRAASDEDYPVILGISEGPDRIIMRKGLRSKEHDYLMNGILNYSDEELRWRYIPLTQTVYWWKSPNMEIRKATDVALKQKYGVTVKRHFMLDDQMAMAKKKSHYMTSHHRHENLGTVKRVPNFQEWYKAHQGD